MQVPAIVARGERKAESRRIISMADCIGQQVHALQVLSYNILLAQGKAGRVV